MTSSQNDPEVRTNLERALASLDVGLQQAAVAPGGHLSTYGLCWRCNAAEGKGPLGVCAECRDWLHGDDEFLSTEPEAMA